MGIGLLEEIGTDFGNPIEWEIRTFVRSPPRSNFLMKRLYLQATTGKGNENKTVSAAFSKDGVHFFTEVFKSLGKIGDYSNEVSWGAPIGRFDNFCGIKLRMVVPLQFPIDKIWADFE